MNEVITKENIMGNSVNDIVWKINWIKPNLCSFNALMSKSPISVVRLNITLLLKLLLFIPINTPKNMLNWVFISYYRHDLLKDFDAICANLYPKYTKVQIKPYQRFTIVNLKVSDLIFSWKEASKIILPISTQCKSTFLAKIFIFLSILNGIKLIRFLERKKVCINSLLSTMEMQTVENILVQYFRLCGAKTFAYQHGFYRDTGDVITRDNSNPVNYLAAVSETALVWGYATKKIINKYTSQIAVPVGKATLLGETTTSSNNNVLKKTKIILILDSIQQLDLNTNIVKAICKSLGKENFVYYIPHPDDKYDYSQFGAKITSHKQINQEECTLVGCNSSAILQYGKIGFKIFLYEMSDFIVHGKSCNNLSNFHEFNGFKFVEVDSNFWEYYVYKYGNDCFQLIIKELDSHG